MSILRTFAVLMPSDAGNMPYLDILVEGPVGSPDSPVVVGATASGKTVDGTVWTAVPPTGWQAGSDFANAPNGQGDGEFYEVRSRPIRIEQPYGATNNDVESFVPLFNLGYNVSVVCNDRTSTDGCVLPPVVLYSASLIGVQFSGGFDVQALDSPNFDPDYGAVIRLLNAPDLQGKVFTVNVLIAQPNDENRSPTGGR